VVVVELRAHTLLLYCNINLLRACFW